MPVAECSAIDTSFDPDEDAATRPLSGEQMIT
jgi:hypothetical protein